jgi:uncharacterized protein (TIGR02266 family)
LTEERREDRIFARLRCWCESNNVTLYARVGNVSEGGIFLRTRTPFAIGTKAKIRFPGQGLTQPEMSATVAWTREEGPEGPAGMGLNFDPLDSDMRALIRRIIEGEQRLKSGLS